ncbi:type IV toxin-antitoxin system AbiEi family antitoxin domain-containing protein [Mesorhizobium sp. SP-1A]|uniref:type IV toxin-antitoxin system AbiEi family antitoxin domain-containing protein n=1 Tax=Mesorhizobium sp. SP-1A TaxID=3077840 RepID=UPI0028F6D590|nr:type IV toxin-antitoxin system AbiEi family antitoxin domain-containing protein [Mesorhizobium sp. SP-1A]
MAASLNSPSAETALQALSEAGRPMTGVELTAKGVSRMALKRLVEAGVLERVARGIFKAVESNTPMPEDPRAVWAWASIRNPSIVFCLESAAAFHHLTQGMAPKLNIAIHVRSKAATTELTSGVDADYFYWNDDFLAVGVDTVKIEGVDVRITSPERTVVDMFRYSSMAPASIRTERMIESEAFHDCLMRFFEKQSDPAEGMKKLRKVAKPLGLWDRMKPQIELVAMTIGRDYRG